MFCESEPDSTDCKALSEQEIYALYKDAVVSITSEFVLTTAAAPTVPTAANSASYLINSNGFFVRDHYIVCPSLAVLIPPALLATANRYPYVAVNQPAPTGVVPNAITRVSRILVTVHNVNGAGRSYVYEASLIGVDGAGNVALLRLDPRLPYNCKNPRLGEVHPRLRWGYSREAKNSDPVYTIGDFSHGPSLPPTYANTNSIQSIGIAAGILSNKRSLDYNGVVLPELVFVDFVVFPGKFGSPILDRFGQILGMITNNTGNGRVSGPSQFFMKEPLTAFLCAPKSDHLAIVADSGLDSVGIFLSYFRYIKAYIGTAYSVVTASSYDTTVDPTTGTISVNLNTFLGSASQLPACKEIAGIKVSTLAGSDLTTYITVPGATPTVTLPALEDSPLLDIIAPGDIVVALGGYVLGGGKEQIAPALYTWSILPGRLVVVQYKSAIENYATLHKTTVAAIEYPLLLDYPYNSSNFFPVVVAPAAPITPNPYLPSLTFGTSI